MPNLTPAVLDEIAAREPIPWNWSRSLDRWPLGVMLTVAERDALVAMARSAQQTIDAQHDVWFQAGLNHALDTMPSEPTPAPTREETWQPIETAPKDGTDILLKGSNWIRTAYWARRIERWSVDMVGGSGFSEATHWAPIPGMLAPTREET